MSTLKSFNNKKTKYRIGILIGKLEESYQARLWPPLVQALGKKKADAVFFVGNSLNVPKTYDYQHNIVYEIINPRELDGLIVFSGALGTFIKPEELINFLSSYKNVPMVSLALSLEGIPSILVDNKTGIAQIFRHLIEVHDYNRIAFIRGPKDHQEAEDRYQAYLHSLNDYNISFNPDLVINGNLQSDAGYKAIDVFLNKRKLRPQAVVAANDVMALGALRFLNDHDLTCPKDMAIVGFDDIYESGFSTPPITTIQQPLHIQAQKAVDLLIDSIEKKNVPLEIVLPTRLIIRESCGCFLDDSQNRCPLVSADQYHNQASIQNVIKDKKDLIIKQVFNKLDFLLFDLDDVKKWLNQLLDAFIQEFHDEKPSNNFTHMINEILIHINMNRERYAYWVELLQNLKDSVLSYFTYENDILLIQSYFQKAEVRLQEIMLRTQYHNRTRLKKILDELNEINQRLLTTIELEVLLYEIAKEFPFIGIKRFFIFLFDKPVKKYFDNHGQIPDDIKLVVSCENLNNKKILFREDLYIPLKHITRIPLGTKNNINHVICMPLYLREEQFGFIFFEISPVEEIIYDALRFQVSSAIKGAYLIEGQKRDEEELLRALIKLEHMNKELTTLTLKDELTGLNNRRAFYTLGEQHLRLAQRNKTGFLLFYADLDNLKMINDSFGHTEGDYAIITAGRILLQSFRKADIVARFGGDEYTIIAINAGENDKKILLKNLRRNLNLFNQSSKKEYNLSISIGVAHWDYQNPQSIDDLLKKADSELYKEKKKRKKKANFRKQKRSKVK